MRAVVVTEHGGVDVLAVQQRPDPEPGPGEVLVEVAAAGVNFKDVYMREGVYPGEPPFVLGDECAGRVVAVGAGVDGIGEGDVVATASARGGQAELAVVDAAQAVPVPEQVPADLAAAALLQGMTAHYLVHSTYPVAEGDEVLVHAAAGGVGRLLVQLATAQGARVVATVGSAAKVAVARAAGADVVLRTDEIDAGDLAAAVRDVVPDGVHVVYDGVGRATFEASLAALRPRGLLALFGASSGQVPPFDLQRLNPAGSLFVTRPTLAHYAATRAELLQRAGDVFAGIADGSLDIAVGGRYPLADVATAYRDLEGRRTTGKLLLAP
ncbi:NADPH2:quinone reductase [Jatrophihabitans endophyticus]|uniref:NADPH2:quinone reductase n=1 Tax=Jatrophihabitans endophyticus TaxID=1206085 RepID=A0A1M5LGC3_9ACTN|nr:quinone oxidoreductase [Jatrophihabitans endophyticus]SHG64015.1 NADPH2:quinone reductase [Jatrophihabitans endophyticus]